MVIKRERRVHRQIFACPHFQKPGATGRELIMGRDYLARSVGVNAEGLEMEVVPDYLKHHSVKRTK